MRNPRVNRRSILDPNRALLDPMVGFHEYRRALELLDQFVNAASAEELSVADGIVRDEKKFAIYTNLSTLLRGNRSSTLRPPERRGDDNKRAGLAWIMALARIEVSAMGAVFTGDKRAFLSYRPSRYELSAYREILLDGLRAHHWAFTNDPRVPLLRMTRKGDPDLLVYYQRMVLLDAFFNAADRYLAPALSPAQQAELRDWRNHQQEFEQSILRIVTSP